MRKRLLNLCLMALFGAFSTAAWALSEVGGVYQIGTADDLLAFAELVNGGEIYANAVLTADIDKGADGTMIGTAENKYSGTFDGAGHTITINMFSESSTDLALFHYTGFGAIIQNLKVTGEMTTNQKFAAGIVARNYGTIRGCYVDVVINSMVAGDATHGGIVAVGYGGTLVENCLAKITILGEATENCGGVVGWAEKRSNIVNCLAITDGSTLNVSNGISANIARNGGNLKTIDVETYNADPYANRPQGASYNNYVTQQWGDNVATTVVPLEDLADGRICYQLNNDQSRIAWVQTIGTDPFPVPAAFGSGRVYASVSTACDGLTEDAATYSNSGSDLAAKHQFDKYGVCTVCGCFDFHYFEDANKFDPVDRAVVFETTADIDKAEGWNRIANGFRLNMKLANDIEYIAEPGKYIFNSSDWIDGNFNGQGHAFTIGLSDVPGYAGLFPEMAGNIENLILHGTIETTGARVGSLCAEARMALVRNVYSDVDITSSVAGDNTSGGFFGWTGDVEKHVENCIYAGTFTLPGAEGGAHCARVGGFSGWTAAKTYYTNCAVLGNIIGAGNQTLDDDTENSQNIARNPGNVVAENVYVVNPIEGNAVSDHESYTHYDNTAGIANGELAFFLNSKQNGLERFYQVIGTDPEPMPIAKEGGLIYSGAATYRCDGTPLGSGGYSNSPSGETVIPPHTFVDGWCTVCGKFDENFITPVDGWFEVSNAAELAWWSNYAVTHPDVSVRLTADIDMSGYMENFALVQMFVGTFDGQGHTISNFVINSPGANNIGLISSVGDGAVVKNVVLDKTCSLFAANYAGVIGTTSGGGTIYVTGVGFEGEVGVGTRNAAGIVGVCQGGSMNMIITNCWVTGTITSGVESGAICGYSGSGSVVTNCWSTCQMPQSAIYSSDSFTRGNAKVVNCYEADIEGVEQNKQQHYNPTAADRKTITLPLEEVANGALCYNLNGKQFREPTWYQTLEEDEHPYPFDNHGVVIYGADKYFSVLSDEDLANVATAIQDAEKSSLDDIVATQSLIDAWSAAVDALTETEDVNALADAIEAVAAAKAAVMASAEVYKTYIAKCEEIKAFLEENKTFEGDIRAALEAYLSEVEEPDDVNPLGTYEYITDVHTATVEEIQAEIERVTKWLQDAIASGYIAGSDVSKLIPNGDFSDKNDKWNGGFATGYGEVVDENGKIIGVEAFNATGDQYQTVEGMKPGYYLVATHAAFRPSNNRYSYNYASGIYANGIFNYFPVAIEDPVSAEEAEDGVNCNLTIKSAFDLPIYEDYYTTSGEDGIVGYVIQGPTGMAIAANVDRYPVYTIAKVGEDGKLTVGIKNPGTKYDKDWTGWTSLKVTYCGDDEQLSGDALDLVLANMAERARTIIEFNTGVNFYTDETYAEDRTIGPNFPQELRDQLEALVDQAESVEGIEAKDALVKKFSDLFQAIYEGKQAYVSLFDYADMLSLFESFNLDLVEKDDAGEYFDTGEQIFSETETEAIYDATEAMYTAFNAGSYTTAQALNPEVGEASAAAIEGIVPEQDKDGYYLIGNPKQFAAYRAIASEMDKYAKGKLIADVDMAGVAMLPIGHNRGENAVHIFAGELDGQGHALENVYIDDARIPSGEYAEPATLFYELQNATVKNLKLTGEMFTSHQFSGPVTRWMSGKSTIDNVEIAVAYHLASNLAGDASSGGVIGRNGSANSLISNCLVKTQLIGEGENPIWYVGGVAGWADASLVIKNTLILSEYENVGADGDNSRTISRGSKCTPTNVFVTQFFREAEGTLVTPEQLASGEIAWALNNKTGENPYWFQTLGTEQTPHLFGGDVVYYYGGQYINDKPNPQLNAYAYNLNANLAGDKVIVTFKLNAEAESAEVKFSNGYTQAVEGELNAGTHRVTVPASALGDDPQALSYEIAVTGKGTLDVIRIGSSYKVWGPYGMAVNNNPASANFGQLLVAESWVQPYVNGDNHYISENKVGALYAFDADFQPINAADGTPGFYGGLGIKDETPLEIVNGNCFDLKDVRFTEDGRLFVARASGLSNSSVWEINPEDLNEAWKPVFKGGELDEATGITYVGEEEQNRMAIGLAFEGAGEDLKMYVLGGQRSNGQNNATDYNCAIYNLGTATEWSAAPSGFFAPLDGVYTYAPGYVGIKEDGRGGLWFIQNQHSEEYPAIKHFNAEGEEDYSDITTSTASGHIASTPDGNYLAIPQGSGKIVLFETNYVPMANGKIFLNPKQTINVGESSITSLAFDWAGNLYVASGGTETLSRYAIPTENKLVVTPGNGIGDFVEGDANDDGEIDIADYTYILNLMADESYDAKADVNQDGEVDIADATYVLNLMADQE